MVNFDDFKKLDIRIGEIISVKRINNSEKLLILDINLGQEKRQIVAGIGKAYLPDSLIGRQVVALINLEPKILMGVESQGMLLAASEENGNPVLIIPEKKISGGSKIS